MHSLGPETDCLREEYIAEIAARMRTKMTALEVVEQCEEIRTHLNELAKEQISIGVDPVAAMRLAIKSFGDPAVLRPGVNPNMNLAPVSRKKWTGFIPLSIITVSLSTFVFMVCTPLLSSSSANNDGEYSFHSSLSMGCFFGLVLSAICVRIKLTPTQTAWFMVAIMNLLSIQSVAMRISSKSVIYAFTILLAYSIVNAIYFAISYFISKISPTVIALTINYSESNKRLENSSVRRSEA